MIRSLFCLAFFFGAVLYCCKSLQRDVPEKHEDNICRDSYTDISKKVRELSSMTDNIDNINNMIADIMSCAPGRVQKTVRINIPDSGNVYDFLVNGEDDISQLFLEILETEREYQSTSLRTDIKKIM